MQQANDTGMREKKPSGLDDWQERSPLERRSNQDCRQKIRAGYFKKGGVERRTAKERHQSGERRDRWLRVGKWRSEPVFDI